jgi:TonB family protein
MTRPTQSQPGPLVLRTAALWGTYVVASRELARGEPLSIGDAPNALIARPDQSSIADLPIRAVGNGWELDARGVTGGTLHLRGRREDPVALAQGGAPIPIVAGDYGLLQYEGLSLFFQYAEASPPPARAVRLDLPLILAFVFAVITCGGLMLVLYLLFPTLELPKPLELTSPEELKVRFHHREPPPPPLKGSEGGGGEEGAKGAKDKRPKDKPTGGGAKRAPSNNKPSSPSANDSREASKGLSAMTDVMASDVGKEIHDTLGTINSVAQALGGLESANLVLSGQSGLGLKSSGGDGGQGQGVLFGSGTLDTGYGSGAGAGGRGRGAGGSGLGSGRGNGNGSGSGNGNGSGLGGERGLKGGDAPRAGEGLSGAQIQRVVMARTGAYRACYESAAARDPSLRGNVTVAFTIASDGSVSSASIASSSLNNARVEGCVLRQFKRLTFPKADKGTNANYPLVFNPGGK